MSASHAHESLLRLLLCGAGAAAVRRLLDAHGSAEAVIAAIRPETKLFFLETPSNPLTEVADIAVLAEIAHAKGILVAVDNCFCTPALQRPLDLGADLVVHSATKYLDGQGRVLGGAVVGRKALTDDAYSRFACNWADAGASFIGGCCGIGAAHIHTLAGVLRGR